MSTTVSSVGALDTSLIGPSWLLLLGGITRPGHRSARRMAEMAQASGLDVIWFDGLDEEADLPLPERDVSDAGSKIVTVSFARDLATSMTGRLRAGSPQRANGVRHLIWRLRRKIGSLLLSRACWLTVRSDVRRLANHPAPVAIVYTDDHAITSAWYASRIWPSVPVSSELPPDLG